MKKSFTLFYNTLLSLTFSKFLRVVKLVLSHPILSLFSFWATLKTFTIIQKKFLNKHSGNGIGNAYRHALWSAIIMDYCCKITAPEKAKNYCLKMTNLHEELFPNNDLEKRMDIHNNTVGILVFIELLPGIHRQFFETSFIIDALDKKLKTAEKIDVEKGNSQKELIYM
jgi:hypothetical protein